MAVDPNSTTTATTTSPAATATNPPQSPPSSTQPNDHHHQSQSFLIRPPLPSKVASSSASKLVFPISTHQMLAHAIPSPAITSSSCSEGLHCSSHRMRPPNFHDPNLIRVSARPEVDPSSIVSISNGQKKPRNRTKDESFAVVRDRKVKIVKDASLYVLCRSWLINSLSVQNQPHNNDDIRVLPKPLPASMLANVSYKKKDEEGKYEEKEDEESVKNLSPQDLLKRHIKHAKRVRTRLRKERLQKIARYRIRLQLLLPPPAEHLKNDMAAGN